MKEHNSAQRLKERFIEEKERAEKDAQCMKIGQQLAEDVFKGKKIDEQTAEIARLADELMLTKQQLVATQTANDNWRYKYRELAGIGQ